MAEKSISEVLGIPKDQWELFIKGVSVGMIAGSAMAVAKEEGRVSLAAMAELGRGSEIPEEMGNIFRGIIERNKERYFPGLQSPLSSEVINAICALMVLGSGRMFFNSVVS